ncbi:hypothetical protein XF_0573 [Xylella fastidiosa 9a5c]|uniref:Uncharacterized protein n=1 Tax=Xylella fastidiosa (strain 9a5c) TaxID=160492 RepID=Q9PFT4_XYLFA|nr:hypothetical protein XF_0573 [Xylella fastidiosa 9a5c]
MKDALKRGVLADVLYLATHRWHYRRGRCSVFCDVLSRYFGDFCCIPMFRGTSVLLSV